ncbi:MAG: pyruvate kinase alpha/beta domain-containing protein, partial [Rhizomicrobium sp.]
VWGLHCVTTEEIHNLDDMAAQAMEIAEREGFASKGEWVVITCGVPLGVSGTTNMLRVAMVGTR